MAVSRKYIGYDCKMSSRLEALYLLAVARNFTAKHHNTIVAQLGNIEELLSAPDDVLGELPFG